MSDNATLDDLPELSDEDISLLHQITTLAQSAQEPPFRALFAAYDVVFAEQGVEAEHDGVVFRFLLRVGEAARERGSGRGQVDLVGCLKSILQAQGIAVIEEGDADRISEVTREVEPPVSTIGRVRKAQRRVSFDETLLSERSRTATRQLNQHNLLSQPARRGRVSDTAPTKRARSISSQRPANTFTRQSAPKDYQQASPSTVYTSDYDDRANPTLLFQPSQTQLEQNAEAFASTSAIRAARHCLHIWHDRYLILHQSHHQAYAIATAHDQRTLRKQAFDQWRTQLSARKDMRRQDLLRDQQDERASHVYNQTLLYKVFTHWATSATDQRAAVAIGLRHMLRFRYFRRWRTIAVDNAVKARSVLARKYLAVWREMLARRQLREEQAVAACEESRMKRCWRAWFWSFCSRRVEGWRDDNVKRRALSAYRQRLAVLREKDRRAVEHGSAHIARHTLHALRDRLAQQRQACQKAQTHHEHAIERRCVHEVATHARLQPPARIVTLKVQLDLQRRAFRTWHLHLTLCRQSAEVNRKRILHSAWTSWNDTLRSRALGQRIDERVVVECLYKWVLQERLRMFRRTVEGRLMKQVVVLWRSKAQVEETRLQNAEIAFREAQQRRRLVFGMTRLHLAVRRREDTERSAIEFASARALPRVLGVLTEKLKDVRQLNEWARDARFYTLATRTLKVWREQMTQHQHARKREAYARVRARIKIRLVSGCLAQWRVKVVHVRSMEDEAERRAIGRLGAVATTAFDSWRQKTGQLQEMAEQAATLDRQRLLASAFSAIAHEYTKFQNLDDRADAFRHDTELALLVTALKRVQWAQFTAARKAESAEALWARNRDVHVRNMIRTWAAQTATRRAARQVVGDEEPESPSLRPASRAASRSRPPAYIASSPPAMGTATLAYMRTPSRSRRAGRFRPLPTPAAFTPFAFEQSYLSTTPAPLPGRAGPGPAMDDGGGALTPQVTPFARKLRAGGFQSTSARDAAAFQADEDTVDSGVGGIPGLPATPAPAAALRSSVFGGRPTAQGIGTAKSVRFAGASRFGGGHLKSS